MLKNLWVRMAEVVFRPRRALFLSWYEGQSGRYLLAEWGVFGILLCMGLVLSRILAHSPLQPNETLNIADVLGLVLLSVWLLASLYISFLIFITFLAYSLRRR